MTRDARRQPLAGVLLAAATLTLLGAGPPPRRPEARREVSGGPYCGVYCLYAALRTLGIAAPFEGLLDPKYVGSFEGSSAAELKRAASDLGVHAEVMENLSASALRNSPHPVILHVRRPGLHMPYAHWVLFLGVEGDKARIVDPPNAVQLLPFAELLSLWDGVGVVVATEPPNTLAIRAGGWAEQGAYLALATALLGVARLAAGRREKGRRRFGWALVLLPAFAVALAVASHAVHDEGLLRHRSAVAQVVGQHFEPDLPAVTVAEVEALLGQPGVTFLDVRVPEAFAAGHLPGAVNLPVYSGLVERSEALTAIRPEDRVIIYCQSEDCGWGEVVAADLAFRGYKGVALFPAGWRGWREHEQARSAR